MTTPSTSRHGLRLVIRKDGIPPPCSEAQAVLFHPPDFPKLPGSRRRMANHCGEWLANQENGAAAANEPEAEKGLKDR